MKKYGVQIFLVLIIIFLVVIKVNFGYKSEEEWIRSLPTPNPTITPTATPTVVEKELDPDYPLWDKLPYSGKGFVIDRYVEPLTLAIKVKGIDKVIVEQEVWDWLESQEVATDSHELVWE